MFRLVLLMTVSGFASAAVITAPTATITAAPLAKRLVTTAGYRSTGYSDGSTLWGTVTYNLEDQMVATSGDLYRICSTDSACNFFTCSGNYVVSGTDSEYCGPSISSTCSYDVSYTDLSDSSPMTNYWCDTSTLLGWDVYAVTTADDASTPTTRTRSANSAADPSANPSSSPSPKPTPSPTPSPAPPPEKKTAIAPIVGGVIGGLAIIGIIIVAVIFILKKKRNTAHNPATVAPATFQQPPPANYAQPAYYAQHQQQAQMGYNQHMPEKTPAATTTDVNPYYVNGESGPTSPVPQYSANNGAMTELPAGRM